MAKLTERQRRFIQLAIEYETDNARAYAEAYDVPIEKKDSARTNSYALIQNHTIADAIKKGIAENRKRREKIREKEEAKAIKRRIASRDDILAFFTKVMENDKPVKIDGKVIIPRMADRLAAATKLWDINYANDSNDTNGTIVINIPKNSSVSIYEAEKDDE